MSDYQHVSNNNEKLINECVTQINIILTISSCHITSFYLFIQPLGSRFDCLARTPALDYNHGTCHGVGAYLNVHEGPQGIGFRKRENEAVDYLLFISRSSTSSLGMISQSKSVNNKFTSN